MFCEMLENELLPNKRDELNLEIEFDGNLMMQINVLYNSTSEGQSLHMSQHLKSYIIKWTYLRENIERSNSSQHEI